MVLRVALSPWGRTCCLLRDADGTVVLLGEGSDGVDILLAPFIGVSVLVLLEDRRENAVIEERERDAWGIM